jgi:hypothetical protein
MDSEMTRRICGAAFLFFLLPLALSARDPGGVFQVTESANGEYRPAVSMDSTGEFVVAWARPVSVWARRFDRNAKPLGGEFQVDEGISHYVGTISTALGSSGFLVVWDDIHKYAGSSFESRRFGRGGQSKTAVHGLAGGGGEVAADPRGNFMVVASSGERGIFASVWNRRDGRPRSFRLIPTRGVPDVAAGGSGNFIVAWAGAQGILAQRFTATGETRGSRLQVAPGPFDPLNLYRWKPAVAANSQGRFVVVWPGETAIFARFYDPSGEPRTGPVLVANGIERETSLGFDVAMDAEGKVLVVWNCCSAPGVDPTVFARRFEASGAPAGGVFQVSPPDAQGEVAAAAGPKGEFVVVWAGGPTRTILGRRLAWARPGDDPCLFGRGTFVCDAAHDGGEEEVLLRFGGGPGGVPLLGDVDGDGDEDPCVHRGRSFLCDTAHDGGAAEVRLDFGEGVALGDFPLLGDLDGEGRDDACVRRGNQFLCDSAHNGGTAELVVTFGGAGDVPLLGDVDGDGGDDPCVARDGQLACDTDHDGGSAELTIPLDFKPQARDVVLLGDVDGDGDEDPCVYRNGRFLCDTTRDGKADLVIPFAGPGLVPVLGNVDGL